MGNKKKILVLGVLGILGVLGGLGWWAAKKKTTIVSPTLLVSPTPAPEEKLAIYIDEAGFSFEYPEGLSVKDVTPEDEYSFLEVSSPRVQGILKIRVVDYVKTLENWLVGHQAAEGVEAIREITIRGMSGKQIQLGESQSLVTAAVDKGVKFEISSPLNPPEAGQFWNKVHNQIVSSFELTEQKKTSTETIYEEEEVVE